MRGGVSEAGAVVMALCGFDLSQLEDNGVAHVSRPIGCPLDMVANARHLAEEAHARALLSEQKQALAVCDVVSNGFVAPRPSHVAKLAFPEIVKLSIGAPSVIVPVLGTVIPGNDDDQGVFGGGDNAPLPLSAESFMNIAAAIVDRLPLETPPHQIGRAHV